MTFGERIRGERKRLRMQAKELAYAASISPQYINDIEADRRGPPSDDVLERLARAFAMYPDILYVAAGRLPPRLRDTDADYETILDAVCAFDVALHAA